MEKLLVESVDMPDARRPDRLTISLPKGLGIVIIRTNFGYVLDVYHKDGRLLSALNVWDDQIEEGDDEV